MARGAAEGRLQRKVRSADALDGNLTHDTYQSLIKQPLFQYNV